MIGQWGTVGLIGNSLLNILAKGLATVERFEQGCNDNDYCCNPGNADEFSASPYIKALANGLKLPEGFDEDEDQGCHSSDECQGDNDDHIEDDDNDNFFDSPWKKNKHKNREQNAVEATEEAIERPIEHEQWHYQRELNEENGKLARLEQEIHDIAYRIWTAINPHEKHKLKLREHHLQFKRSHVLGEILSTTGLMFSGAIEHAFVESAFEPLERSQH